MFGVCNLYLGYLQSSAPVGRKIMKKEEVKKIVKTKKALAEKSKIDQPKVVKLQTEKAKKAAQRAVAAASKKVDLIEKYQSHKEDTGSIEVQIAVLTKKVSDLTKHLREHKKDFDSRRGLLMMVGKRRRLLNYLKKTDEDQYNKLIADLGLRR